MGGSPPRQPLGWRARIVAPCHAKRARVSDGFTLLEVLVAFVIVGLALAAIIGVFETGLAGVTGAEKRAIALILAESKMAEIGITEPLESGRQEGAFAGDYRWRTTIAALPASGRPRASSVVAAYRVDVEVHERAALGANRPLIHLKTVRLLVAPRDNISGGDR